MENRRNRAICDNVGHAARNNDSFSRYAASLSAVLCPATNNNGVVVNDSMDLHVLIGWKQVINPFNFDPYPPMNEIIYNNQLMLFGKGSINGTLTSTIWTTPDGTTWTKLANSIPFTASYQFCLLFLKVKSGCFQIVRSGIQITA